MAIVHLTCERTLAEEIVKELQSDPENVLTLTEDRKNFEGGTQILTIIADLSTIGVNVLTAWLLLHQEMKKRIKIDDPEKVLTSHSLNKKSHKAKKQKK